MNTRTQENHSSVSVPQELISDRLTNIIKLKYDSRASFAVSEASITHGSKSQEANGLIAADKQEQKIIAIKTN